MNDKQDRFVEEYIKTFNRTKAALAAGYSPKTAYSQGARLLKNVEIAKAVSDRLGEIAMTSDEVLMRVAKIARGDIGDMLKVDGENVVIDLVAAMDEKKEKKTGLIKRITQRKLIKNVGDSVIEEVTTSLELHDPLTALQLLGKNHRLFVDKTELSGPNDGAIELKNATESTERIIGRLHKLAARIRADSGDQRDSDNTKG